MSLTRRLNIVPDTDEEKFMQTALKIAFATTDMEISGKANKAQLVIGNSHAVDTAERLGVPILRAGFPLYDIIGGYQKTWIGYRGTRQTLFDLANLVINYSHEEIPVYHSIYGQKPAHEQAKPCH